MDLLRRSRDVVLESSRPVQRAFSASVVTSKASQRRVPSYGIPMKQRLRVSPYAVSSNAIKATPAVICCMLWPLSQLPAVRGQHEYRPGVSSLLFVSSNGSCTNPVAVWFAAAQRVPVGLRSVRKGGDAAGAGLDCRAGRCRVDRDLYAHAWSPSWPTACRSPKIYVPGGVKFTTSASTDNEFDVISPSPG